MLGYLVTFLVVIHMPTAQAIGVDSNGVVDEVVVAAPRYEHEDIAWSGLMPEVIAATQRHLSDAEMGTIDEVTVTALRYEYEDSAWSGLMPEIICTASNDKAPPVLFSFLRFVEKGEDRWHYKLLIIEKQDPHIITQHN